MKPISFSRAEIVAIAFGLLMLVLQAIPDLGPLEYRNTNAVAEPWRWLTAHFVHVNWQHALINAVALWVVARLFAPDLNTPRQLWALLAAAVAVSAGLATFYPTIDPYRGLSGALHGLFFAGSALWLIKARPRRFRELWLPAALFFGGWIKVVLEQPGDATTPYAEWLGAGVVPQAHLFGAACGTVLGLLFAISDANASRQQQRR
ncbi:MAG TPA: rhombosortase [Burkholderiaceae bacterium]|nr:rhombosortase [Burkholderiaceae bacterium]